MNVPNVVPKPASLECRSDLYEDLSIQPNGNYGAVSNNSGPQLAHGIQGGKTRKPNFQGSFKQAVFMNLGNEDGSSKLQVSFTSGKTKSHAPKLDMSKQLLSANLSAGAVQKSKPKVGKCPKIIQLDMLLERYIFIFDCFSSASF